ncbi:MAG: RNA polymerase sigma factor [Chloroflexi bacterium]|nr:RNA polymerase sigma factor [Chloroflexota bacterium]
MAPSDEALLVQFKAGDARAFRTLVDRYSAPIYNVAYRFLRDPMEAENVTQETFLRLVTALGRLRLDTPIKPYLFRVAVNLCRDLARKKHPLLFGDLVAAGREDAGVDEPGESVPDDAPPLWEHAVAQERWSGLADAVDQLSAIYRTVIVLRYVEEFSYEEIALALDLPINTVRTHLRRAKIRLKEILESDADASPVGRSIRQGDAGKGAPKEN